MVKNLYFYGAKLGEHSEGHRTHQNIFGETCIGMSRIGRTERECEVKVEPLRVTFTHPIFSTLHIPFLNLWIYYGEDDCARLPPSLVQTRHRKPNSI